MGLVQNFIIPLIKTTFYLGIFLGLGLLLGIAFYKRWKKTYKWLVKYDILRKKLPEQTIEWCFKAIEKGMNYYQTKKFLYLNGINQEVINETMFIYRKIEKELSKQLKGGIKNGRNSGGNNCKIESTEKLPSIETV